MPEIKTVMTADTSQFERAMRKAQTTASSSSTKIEGGFSKVGGAFTSIASKAGLVGAAIGTVTAALGAISGKNIDLARKSFDDLATSFNVSGDKMLAKLQAVSNGMITDFDLIQAASRAMVLGLQPDAIVKYLEIAAASSKATGQTMTQAFDDITIGVARQSRMILDNLGIIVSVDKANEKYAKTLGITTDALTDNQKAMAFQTAVMEAGQRQINILGSDTEKVMSESARLIAQVTNWWDKFATTMGKALNFVSGAINMFISETGKAYDFLFSQQDEAEKRFKIGAAGEALPITNVGYDLTTPLNGNGVQAKQDQAEISSKRAQEIEKIYDQINKTINKYTTEGTKSEIDLINYKWDQEIEKAKGSSELIKEINFAREVEINAKNKELYDERKALLDQQRYDLLDEHDAELAELQDWYDKVMELEGLTQEERLAAQQTFEDRRREIQLEALAQQLNAQSEYEDKMQQIKEQETKEKERQHKIQLQGIQAFGQLALEYGGEFGEKLFRVSQGVAAAQAIVDTHAAVMKTMASVPYPYNIPLAAAQAAIGASEVASILSTSVGSTSVSSSGGGGSTSTDTSVSDVTPTEPAAEEQKGSYTINIMGDIMNEDYVDLLAEKISDAVQDRNVILKASQARTVRG